MAHPDDELVVLVSLSNEVQASLIVGALQDEGIQAVAPGGFTSGFKDGIAGAVQVLVRRADRKRAQRILDGLGIQHETGEDPA